MMKAINLKTEYLVNPIGIDILKPCLSWNAEDGITQTAYKIVGISDGEQIFDSGKVKSAKMTGIECPVALTSRQKITWRVMLWEEKDNPGDWSDIAWFEAGLLNIKHSDWQAKWITGNYRPNKKKRYPVDCFRKEFSAGKIAKARLYASACGLYQVRINGEKAGNFCLAPGITDYRRRIQYQTYDVTDLIQSGKNEITAELADGWYRGSTGAWGLRNQYGRQTKLLLQLELTDDTGRVSTICTDETWAWSNDGSIRFADNKDGEIVEAFRTPSYSGRAKIAKHTVIPTASNNLPLTEHEHFTAKVIKTPSGKTILDFGQNIAGYIAFSLGAKKGQKISLRFGELIDGSGEFTQKNIQCSSKWKTTPLQQVQYTCREGQNDYKTQFAIFGFQYVLIKTDVPFRSEDFTAIAVYSDFTEILKFDCSHELINQFVNCTRWSAKNNHADLPTDCPTRERHGWTGDAQIFANTAGYFFDYAAFARKYVRMLTDEQKKNGVFPQIVPSGGVDFYMKFMDGSAGWSDAGIIIPYRMWKLFGDEKIIADNYTAMKKYADFMVKRIGKWYPTAAATGVKGKAKRYLVNYGQSYGEWAEPEDVQRMSWKDFAVPHPEVSTAYTCYVLNLLAEICNHLDKTEEANRYTAYADKTKSAYQALCQTEKFTLDTDRQARLVRPLAFGLLSKEQEDYAKKRLIKALENYGWRLGTGFLSTPLILNVLADIDTRYAYRLLENEAMPGWLFMPKSGANTIWEAWEGTKTTNGGIASLNHYSKGAVCEWLFSEMCGIHIAGENAFVLAPKPGGSIAHASCEYASVYGRVKSGWKRENGRTIFSFTLPANTTAKIILPDGERRTVAAGEYQYILVNNGE